MAQLMQAALGGRSLGRLPRVVEIMLGRRAVGVLLVDAFGRGELPWASFVTVSPTFVAFVGKFSTISVCTLLQVDCRAATAARLAHMLKARAGRIIVGAATGCSTVIGEALDVAGVVNVVAIGMLIVGVV